MEPSATPLGPHLAGLGLFPKAEWLFQCLSFLRNDESFDSLPLERQSERVYLEYLQSDFSTSAAGCLPANMKVGNSIGAWRS